MSAYLTEAQARHLACEFFRARKVMAIDHDVLEHAIKTGMESTLADLDAKNLESLRTAGLLEEARGVAPRAPCLLADRIESAAREVKREADDLAKFLSDDGRMVCVLRAQYHELVECARLVRRGG